MDSAGDEIRRQLRAHGEARFRAGQTRARETAAIRQLVPKAIDAGLTKVEVAKLAQISRPALDEMLGKKP